MESRSASLADLDRRCLSDENRHMGRHSGSTSWADQDGTAAIEEVIIGGDRIAFDLTFDDYEYTVVLKPAAAGDPWWIGTWTSGSVSGHVEGRLYTSSDGRVVLAGRWKEDQEDYRWYVEIAGRATAALQTREVAPASVPNPVPPPTAASRVSTPRSSSEFRRDKPAAPPAEDRSGAAGSRRRLRP